jgi:hypothetical protein
MLPQFTLVINCRVLVQVDSCVVGNVLHLARSAHAYEYALRIQVLSYYCWCCFFICHFYW